MWADDDWGDGLDWDALQRVEEAAIASIARRRLSLPPGQHAQRPVQAEPQRCVRSSCNPTHQPRQQDHAHTGPGGCSASAPVTSNVAAPPAPQPATAPMPASCKPMPTSGLPPPVPLSSKAQAQRGHGLNVRQLFAPPCGPRARQAAAGARHCVPSAACQAQLHAAPAGPAPGSRAGNLTGANGLAESCSSAGPGPGSSAAPQRACGTAAACPAAGPAPGSHAALQRACGAVGDLPAAGALLEPAGMAPSAAEVYQSAVHGTIQGRWPGDASAWLGEAAPSAQACVLGSLGGGTGFTAAWPGETDDLCGERPGRGPGGPVEPGGLSPRPQAHSRGAASPHGAAAGRRAYPGISPIPTRAAGEPGASHSWPSACRPGPPTAAAIGAGRSKPNSDVLTVEAVLSHSWPSAAAPRPPPAPATGVFADFAFQPAPAGATGGPPGVPAGATAGGPKPTAVPNEALQTSGPVHDMAQMSAEGGGPPRQQGEVPMPAAMGVHAVPVHVRLALAPGGCLDIVCPYNENLRQALARWARGEALSVPAHAACVAVTVCVSSAPTRRRAATGVERAQLVQHDDALSPACYTMRILSQASAR